LRLAIKPPLSCRNGVQGRRAASAITGTFMKLNQLFLLGLALACCVPAGAQENLASPAAMISNFRSQHGEGRVTLDARLDRVAQAQADAMAARDVLEHNVLGPFNTRVASAGAGRAAENIAYGYDSFAKTLDQWINSAEHRRNLLMHGASKVGIAHAQSPATHRTYWAMVIAGEYERKPPAGGRLIAGPSAEKPRAESRPPAEKPKPRSAQACRLKILGLCL
jgi:uncharacterized protein YkwD